MNVLNDLKQKIYLGGVCFKPYILNTIASFS